MLATSTDCVDIFRFEQAVVGFNLEALVQQLQVDLASKTH